MNSLPRFCVHSLVILLMVLVFGLAIAGRTGFTVQVHAARSGTATTAHTLALKGIQSPNIGPGSAYLGAAGVVSANDVWAVGAFVNSSGVGQTLTENWNGSSWSVVTSPNVGSGNNYLEAVAAISANDVWAVGYNTSSGVAQTLTENWNGSSWSIVTSPNVGSGNNYLPEVAVVSANDVWAVGDYQNSSGIYQTLTEHWDGTKWSVITSPNVGSGNNALNGVVVVSANDVWIVGESTNSSGVGQTLTENWNGTKWGVVKSPNVGSSNNLLYSVAAIATNDVWAVGDSTNSSSITRTLTEHWNGTKWSVVKSSNAGSSNNLFSRVRAIATNDVWAVGYSTKSSGITRTLTEHWNGTKWSVVTSPNVGSSNNLFYGATTITTNDVWAVGDSTKSSGIIQTLTEHWDGTKWSVVTSPN